MTRFQANSIKLNHFIPVEFPPITKSSFTLSANSGYSFIAIAMFVRGPKQTTETLP